MSRQPSDTRDLPTREPTAAGTKVYDADGTHVGMVSNPTHRDGHLVVELGLLAMRLAFLPQDTIASVDDKGVHLNVTHDELASGRYSNPPADTGRVANAPSAEPHEAATREREDRPIELHGPATTPPPSLMDEGDLNAPRGHA